MSFFYFRLQEKTKAIYMVTAGLWVETRSSSKQSYEFGLKLTMS